MATADPDPGIEVVNTSLVVVLENDPDENFYVSNSEGKENVFSCKVCEKQFQTKQGVKSHATKMHKQINVKLSTNETPLTTVQGNKRKG